jgi:aldose 1-epimerase
MSDRYSTGEQGGVVTLRDSERKAEARIEPARGNNVTHFRTTAPGSEQVVEVFLSPQGDGGLGANGYSAGNPILFPFPNRVKGGAYTFDGKTHQLDVNETARGNHIHGLVSNRAWTSEATGADETDGAWHRASFTLDSDPEIRRQYPFPCTITVTTRVRDGQLEQETVVRNTGKGTLPMGYGTHPWFPATMGGGDRAKTEVKVPGKRYWKLENLVPTGETVEVTAEPDKYDLRDWHALDGNEYDDVFTDLDGGTDGWTEAGIRFPEAGLQIIMEAGPEFRHWVIFAPQNRAVICLEPYTGTTNAVNLANEGVAAGLVVLGPGEEWKGTIRTSVRSEQPG